MTMPNFTPNELVWYEKDGEIHSSGYKVESLFKTLGVAPMQTLNEPMNGGRGLNVNTGEEQVSDLFRFMGVPAGLSAIVSDSVNTDYNEMTGGSLNDIENDIHRVEKGLISNSLFDKLTELAGPDMDETKINGGKKKRTTRRLRFKNVAKSTTGKKKRTTRKKLNS